MGGGDESLYSFMTAPDTNDDEEACSSFLSTSSPDAKASLSFSVTPHCSSLSHLHDPHQNTVATITSEEDPKVVLSPPPQSTSSSLQTMGDDAVHTSLSSSSVHPPPPTGPSSGSEVSGGIEKRKKKTTKGRGSGSSSSSRGDARDLNSSPTVPIRQNQDISSTSSSSRHNRQQEEDDDEEEDDRRPKGDWDDEREVVEEEEEIDENGVMLHSGSSTDGGRLSSNKVEDGGEVDEKKKERPAHACAYCGISSPDCVLKCCCCGKYFCNSPCSTGGSIGSHVIFHLVRSHHNEVMLHPDGPLGESRPVETHMSFQPCLHGCLYLGWKRSIMRGGGRTTYEDWGGHRASPGGTLFIRE